MKCYRIQIVSTDGLHTRYYAIKSIAYIRFIELCDQYKADAEFINHRIGNKTIIAEAISEQKSITLTQIL